MMKNLLFQNKLLVLGILIGAVAGFLYWKLVGCDSGTCMITSKWHNSTAYGAAMGGLIFSIFKKEKNEPNNK
jgi:H+/Cl- antiporter ClcA